MNLGIRSYSSVHKVRNYFPTMVKPRMIIDSVYFAVPDRAIYEDTYFDIGTRYFSYNGTAYQIDAYEVALSPFTPIISTVPDQTITGHIVMHEIGNGINDSLLNKVILEAMPDSTWNTYDYTGTDDPYLGINTRSSAWVDGQGELVIDLVALNMTVKGGLNPFCSVMQTPNVEGTGDRVTFSGDDRFIGGSPADSQGKPVESLVLLAPMNTKFRRMLLTFRSSKVAVIRTITVIMSEYTRRGWG